MSPEIRRQIAEEVRRQVNIILSGQAGTTGQFTETIENLFPGMPSIEDRPVMQPFGVSSRAPRGTISVTARQGEHAGNRLVLGHRDANKPPVQSGETTLYNEFGQQIYLQNGSIRIGNQQTDNPAVVGNEMKSFLLALIDWLLNHNHVGNLGAPTSPPVQAADLSTIKAQNIDNDNILSQLVFILKGGS